MTNVKLPRRRFLHLAAGAAGYRRCRGSQGHKAYPARPITMIVPCTAAHRVAQPCDLTQKSRFAYWRNGSSQIAPAAGTGSRAFFV